MTQEASTSRHTSAELDYPIVDEAGLIALLRDRGSQGVALDIDETLSWTVGHWMKLMLEKFGNPEGLSPKQMADKYHLCQRVPYWAGRPEIESWMQAQRDNNALQEQLPLMEGALQGAAHLHTHIGVVAYITVRPQSVLLGTQTWLRRHGFPPAPILGKPDSVPFAQGNAWKGGLLPRLYPQVQGLVDDNPSVLAAVPPGYPGTVFLLGGAIKDLDPSKASPCKVVPCPDWEAARQGVVQTLCGTSVDNTST
mmetsp:Transcript_16170/g.35026  ORF Transcript_16170/g.35026 Transcript_16170/m.35026 type:complete len:252 (+) Transcript_16170:164-919(+)|eukprot:CAMPEP_0202922982 /NCGR_PEP_ID=MMETSP1392-20130828/78198_1 /ASSEMBLY_ACC=CAM_ASM_000868 /TAXON_ID=225041 /ORGANISM="Chlamydomonas chlamydogama, Strain SAG 11-48b" /LENGTH=251 /DNA_ID=CAMNT_0049616639 /DNA_START=154 /DNA_END=909 /DNA_ORIENTATION=+